MLRRAPASDLNEEDYIFYLRTYHAGVNVSTGEVEHEVYLVFPSPKAQFKCSIVLSRALGFNKVTTKGGTRPWHSCDAGCCARPSPSAPVAACPVAAHHTYLVAARPQNAGRPAPNIPYEILSHFEALPRTTVHYNAQALNPLASPWLTVRVSSAADVKANGLEVKQIMKSAGKDFTIHRVKGHCDLCGDYVLAADKRRSGHNTNACPELERGDPHKMVVDAPALMYRGKRAKALCKVAGDDACSDPHCTYGHHGCSIVQSKEHADGTSTIYREILTRPRASKRAQASTEKGFDVGVVDGCVSCSVQQANRRREVVDV